jgi:hypothetical protein
VFATVTTEQLNIIVPAITTIAGATIGAAISYLVGRQQFNANVVSANRQAWINTLRDAVSEYQSCVSGMTVFLTAGQIHSSEFRERLDRLLFLDSKIKLLINPDEANHQKLVEIVSSLRSISQESTGEELKRMLSLQDELTVITQKILKSEWERVKKGQ